MKVTKVPSEINAYTLSFSDKVVFIALMEALTQCVISETNFRINDEYISLIHAKKIFKILSDLGCRTGLGETYEDIIKQKENVSVAK